MKCHFNRKHVVDIIFPFAVFFVFAASSLLVILLAADIYRDTTAMADSNYESRTVLSYMREKIHQADENAGVSIGSFDGHDSVIIRQSYGQQNYQTYIYEDGGVLRELFLQEGVEASAADGRKIMEVHNLQLEQLEKGLFRISCTAREGEKLETVVAVVSE